MNIFKYLKNIFTGKENIVIHFSIFALCGIMAVAFNGVYSIFTGNSLYAIFAAPRTSEAFVWALLLIILFLYFIGYNYKFVNSLLMSDEKVQLPTVSLNCFVTFLKVLPVAFVWGIYLFFISFLGLCFLNIRSFEFKIYFCLILLLAVFTNIIIAKFSKDFRYTKDIFSPATILKTIHKTFVPVLWFLVQFVLVSIVVFLITNGLFYLSLMYMQSRLSQLISLLLTLCLGTYMQQVLILAYYYGISEIIKKKFTQ